MNNQSITFLTNQKICELLNIPKGTVEFTLRGKVDELPTLELVTLVGVENEKAEQIARKELFNLVLIDAPLEDGQG